MPSYITIKGARENNLQNVDIVLPRDKLVVVTGVSGSGKSTLAFDTIYADGQRRYVESLSAYARQFLQSMRKPDVDLIEGLSPAISIEQKSSSRNPRSTVGTITEIYDYVRLLFARIGIVYSPTTGFPIESQTVSQMVDRILAMGDGARLYLLAPIVRGRKGEYRGDIAIMKRKGYVRLKIDGAFYNIDEVPALDKNIKHDIAVVVDRVVLDDESSGGGRLAESVETVLALSDGLLQVQNATTDEVTLLSANFVCPESGFTIEELEPRLFSFNSPYGACGHCGGLGHEMHFVPELVILEPSKSLMEGAIASWPSPLTGRARQTLSSLAVHFDFDLNTPFEELPESVREMILYGCTDKIEFQFTQEDSTGRSFRVKQPFEGIIPNLQRRMKETDSSRIREEIGKFQQSSACSKCFGYRLKTEALAVKVNMLHIGEVCAMSILQCQDWFKGLPKHLNSVHQIIAAVLLEEILERLSFLDQVGLGYLALSRGASTLSGGESQRIRLASQIGSGLTGVLYVLDEPSIGLHQRDNAKLLKTLFRLRDLGNSVIVVEHDEDAIRSADHLIDMGPGAGLYGGWVVAEGPPKDVIANKKSLTGDYLSGRKFIEVLKRRPSRMIALELRGARGNNLQNVDVTFPLEQFVAISGVSGSGKSTLVLETLQPALSCALMHSRAIPLKYESLTGIGYLDKCININQLPIGRTPRSNPVTYIGAFTLIRDWFTQLPESRARGYKAGRFSFNVKGGRCERCQGDGVLKIEMHFLPDVFVPCEECKGKRYNRETIEIRYQGLSIADVLALSVDEALEYFENINSIHEKLRALQEVGLGYIKIGQQATTLSGGEAQRVKLARELSRKATGRTVYILDEPTTGLHFEDIRKLLKVLHRLVDHGNSVLVIEHNLEVLKTADWIIDVGPEGGDAGGQIVAVGTPEEICRTSNGHTARYLKKTLEYSAKMAKNQAELAA
ncbi:MAG: excinuclease ABC subunit UvrA [Alphaproteobacteria bacterium]|nr:excinuclease ABC subunit UvrA [Alphaproteobacteria bacterium]